MNDLRVLQVEDSESDAALVLRLLAKGGYDVRAERVEDAAAMRAALAGTVWDVIIADYRLPSLDAPAALEILHESGLDLPFIVVSGTIGEDLAVAMMKAGAHDYLMKDNLARLAPAVRREINDAHVRKDRRLAEQALRTALGEAEQRRRLLDTVIAAQTDGVFVCDQGGQVIQANPAAARLFGFDPTGMPTEDILGRLEGKVAAGGFAACRALDGETVIAAELAAAGRVIETSAAPIRDQDGALAGAVTICRDISERKRHEADRESMMDLLRLLNSPTEAPELIRSATAMMRRWLDCEAVGLRFSEGVFGGGNWLCAASPDCLCDCLFHRETAPVWTNHGPEGSTPDLPFERCFPQYRSVALAPLRSSRRLLGVLQFADRRPDRFSLYSIALLDRAATSLAIALEQRWAQDALRASEERYRLISENTGDVIWVLNAELERYTFMSPSVRHVLGYAPEELLVAPPWLTLTGESRERAERRIAQLIRAQRSGEAAPTQAEPYDQVSKDGSIVRTEISTTLMPSRPGDPCEILGVTRDISERVQIEARLLQAQKLESVGRLAGGVAHDFNNLLTVINGYSQMLLNELPEGSPMRENAAEISAAGERAAALTAQLLMLSRKQVAQPKIVNFNEIVKEVEKMLGRVIGEDILLKAVLSPDAGCVMADSGQLHQVLMNLAVNARDAMPGGGTLLIETSNLDVTEQWSELHPDIRPGRYVQVEVSDTGIGMSPDVLAHLFEPFFTTKRAGEGTGLGLATVYGIVKQCGGSIWVYSEPGTGSRFQICLPRVDADGSPLGEIDADADSYRGAETILLVEDLEQLRKMAARVLRGRGYQVIEAANVGEALLRMEDPAAGVHLLLTDIVMPGLSGIDLAARLKELRPELKVLFMSGYSQRATEDTFHGAYLAKPFTPTKLAAKVREVLNPQRQ